MPLRSRKFRAWLEQRNVSFAVIISVGGRKTAANYFAITEKEGFLISEKIGKERICQNKRLYDLIKMS